MNGELRQVKHCGVFVIKKKDPGERGGTHASLSLHARRDAHQRWLADLTLRNAFTFSDSDGVDVSDHYLAPLAISLLVFNRIYSQSLAHVYSNMEIRMTTIPLGGLPHVHQHLKIDKID